MPKSSYHPGTHSSKLHEWLPSIIKQTLQEGFKSFDKNGKESKAGRVQVSFELVPAENLKSFFTSAIQKLQSIKGNHIGDYLEFGIFNGSSISSMYLTCKKLGLDSVRFFGFDAFEGLPASSENEDDGVWKKGFYACSFD